MNYTADDMTGIVGVPTDEAETTVQFDRSGDIVYAGEWKDDRYHNGILYKKVQQEN